MSDEQAPGSRLARGLGVIIDAHDSNPKPITFYPDITAAMTVGTDVTVTHDGVSYLVRVVSVIRVDGELRVKFGPRVEPIEIPTE